MKRRLTSVILTLAIAFAGMSTIVSCKDYDEDRIAALETQVADQNATLKQYIDKQVGTLQDEIANLKKQQENMKQCECDIQKEIDNYFYNIAHGGTVNQNFIDALTLVLNNYQVGGMTLQEAITNLQVRIKNLEDMNLATRLAAVEAGVADAQNAAQNALAKAEEALELLKKMQEQIDGLKAIIDRTNETVSSLSESITKLENNYTIMSGQLKEALDKASQALALAQQNANDIANLKSIYGDLIKRIEDLEKKKECTCEPGKSCDCPEMKQCQCNLTKEDLENLKKELESRINALPTMDDVNAAIAEALKDYMKATDLSIYALKSDLSKYVTAEELQKVLLDYVKKGELPDWSEFVKKSDLEAYIKSEDLGKAIDDYLKDKIKDDEYFKKLIDDAITELLSGDERFNNAVITIVNQQLKDYATIDMLDDYVKNSVYQEFIKKCITTDNFDATVLDYLTKNGYKTEAEIKAWLNDYYTKSEIDTKLADYCKKADCISATEVQEMIDATVAGYVKSSELNDLIKNYLDANLGEYLKDYLKADALEGYLKSDALEGYATQQWVNEQGFLKTADLSEFATQTWVNTQLESYVTKAVYDTKMSEIDAAIKALQDRDKVLADSIQDLDKRVTANEEAIEKIQQDIINIQDSLKKIDQTLKSQITGIVIQKCANSILTMNMPINMQTTMLGTYFGMALDDVTFPSFNPADAANIKQSDALTKDDHEIVGQPATVDIYGGDKLLLDGENNAGTLYVTVNPNTVDFSGETLTMENSIGEESAVKLGALKKSDHKITFGVSRAANNGFYECPVQITKSDLDNCKFEIDYEQFIDVAKDLKKTRDLNLTALISALYNNFSDRLDANAVCATWTDGFGDEHKVYSEYKIAAAAVKPMSFGALEPLGTVTKAPGLDEIEKLINKTANKLLYYLNKDTKTFCNIRINNLKLIDDLDNLEVTVELPEGYTALAAGDGAYVELYDKDGNVVALVQFAKVEVKGGKLKLVINKQNCDPMFQEIWDQVDVIVNGKYEATVDEINIVLDKLMALQNEAISDVEDVQNALINYLSKLNSSITSIINQALCMLDPIVLSNEGGFKLLTHSKYNPSKISSSTKLILTSYSGEIIAPAYKKYVAVTNVYNPDGTAASNASSLAASVNSGDLNKVLEGNVYQISASGFQTGYTYELAYSALDYHGKIATKKFYVTVE